MLLKCPECELQVSDKALVCPHCGYPLTEKAKRKPKTKNKRRRLPNGFGQISEIKGRNLRKPFRAMITVGKDDNGRPICKPLRPESYFETYNDAYAALLEHNRNPSEIPQDITMQELYDRWSESYLLRYSSKDTARSIEGCWRYCSSLYKMQVRDVRARHLKYCIENGTWEIRGEVHHTTPGWKVKLKTMFNNMFDYALEYEMTDKNYAKLFKLNEDDKPQTHVSHIDFTDEEMEILWKNISMPYVDMILIECYSGWRPQELCSLKLENINLEEGWMRGGMKTEAGKDRIVPIHSRIAELVKKRYNESKSMGSDYLFSFYKYSDIRNLKGVTYGRYQQGFTEVKNTLGLNPNHKPHDCRVQFVTQAKKYNVDEWILKRVIGHAIADVTEKVYTKRDFESIKEEIEKIK